MTHKILINISVISIFAIQPFSANAVTKCVNLNNAATCTKTMGTMGQYDWAVNCGGTEIRSIGVCGTNDDNLSTAQKTDILNTKASDNTFCYCKMTSPTVSQWVFAIDIGPSCPVMCMQMCLNSFLMDTNKVVRDALLSGPFSD